MDLNQKYSDHQKAVLKASAAPDQIMRGLHLDRASLIAEEIAQYQRGLGAAASCAWSALKMSVSPILVARPDGAAA
jgi:hypothetical protein